MNISLYIQLGIKRFCDIAFALLCLVLGAPLLVLFALIIRFESPGPILFRQLRTGRNRHPFWMYKLRTMYHGAPHLRNPDGSAFVGRNDARVTCMGRFLREFSFDELPQFINVLRGDMSLIGPRPETTDYTAELPEWALAKLKFRPGCLSLPLIHGRNELPWHERNQLDLYYVDNYSLWLDLKIFVLGVWTMLVSRKGVYCPPRPGDASPSTSGREVTRSGRVQITNKELTD
jgi:lipopolysaccharide/colanic/teichoic acid biosynthesis glycosyltransferase